MKTSRCNSRTCHLGIPTYLEGKLMCIFGVKIKVRISMDRIDNLFHAVILKIMATFKTRCTYYFGHLIFIFVDSVCFIFLYYGFIIDAPKNKVLIFNHVLLLKFYFSSPSIYSVSPVIMIYECIDAISEARNWKLEAES